MFKGLLRNKKKGSLSDVTKDNIFVLSRPLVETDPTVPAHVKAISQQNIFDWLQAFQEIPISGTITGDKDKQVTLTRRDGSVLQFSFTDNEGVALDDVINTVQFDNTNGQWTFVTSEGIQITTNSDGRYSLLGHVHEWEQITGKPTTFPPEAHDHDYDNYNFWNLLTNGIQRKTIQSTNQVNFIEKNNIKITYSANGGIEIECTYKSGGTVEVNASRNLLPSDNGKTLIINGNDIILTMPTGLGDDFACNFEMLDPLTGVCEIIGGAGFDLNAPLGNKLLVHYTANLTKKTGVEIGYLRGELTP